MPSPKKRQSSMRRPARGLSLLALAIATATATAQRVVPVGISKAAAPPAAPPAVLDSLGLGRRAAFSNTLINNKNAYFAKVQVGTPPQTVTLHVDTGSSDLWVLSRGADLCNSRFLQLVYGECFDTFDARASSTFATVGRGDFSILYVDQTGADGDYFTDNVRLDNGAVVERLRMGLAHNSTSNWGMMGIGYSANVASLEPYPNIVDLMFEQGLIATKAYSLYLNDSDAETGTILFGGIDTSKFYGTLRTVPVIPNNRTGLYDHFTVALASVTLVDGETSTVLPRPSSASSSSSSHTSPSPPIEVILDSGTTLTYLPPSITTPLFSLLNAVDDDRRSGVTYVDCDLRARKDLYLTFRFPAGRGRAPPGAGPNNTITDSDSAAAEDAVIHVPATEFILDDLQPYLRSGVLLPPADLPWPATRACRMGVVAASRPDDDDRYGYDDGSSDHDGGHGPPYLVGDTFLRSAYAVYDLVHHAVGLAQSNLAAVDADADADDGRNPGRVVELVANETIPAALKGVPVPDGPVGEWIGVAGRGGDGKGGGGEENAAPASGTAVGRMGVVLVASGLSVLVGTGLVPGWW